MTYKTILVHLANDTSHRARIKAATDLAARFKAHVMALYVANPISMPAAIQGRGASYAFMAEATVVAHEKSEAISCICAEACKASGVTWDWKVVEGDHLHLLAKEAPYADLAIVSHSKTEVLEDRVMFHVPENLPLLVGCPVVVLPEAGFDQSMGHHVMIAWQPCPPAYRAVHLAMPFLTTADEVTVCTVLDENVSDEDCKRLVAELHRHRIRANALTVPLDQPSVGQTILSEAEQAGADMLVMGAYGHSRLREMVLGGVTRYTLNHATIPMLLSH